MTAAKGERITDTLTVYQQQGVFSYGTDAVLLADYVSEQVANFSGKTMCDLCSGTGIIPLLLCDRYPDLSAHAVEINPNAAALSEQSAAESGLSARFTVHRRDLKEVTSFFSCEQFDFLTCNPPYMTANCGKMCENSDITLARHEIACTIYDVFAAAFYLLRTGGCLYLVYRTDRLSALMDAARKNRFEIKDICFYRLKPDHPRCDLLVCKAKKNAAEGMTVSSSTL